MNNDIDNLKQTLGYVCRNRCGYTDKLKDVVGDETLQRFKTVGFISEGHTLKSETWKKTRLADMYYRDVFGIWSYIFLFLHI